MLGLFVICLIACIMAWGAGMSLSYTGQGTIFKMKRAVKEIFSDNKEDKPAEKSIPTPTENDDYNQI